LDSASGEEIMSIFLLYILCLPQGNNLGSDYVFVAGRALAWFHTSHLTDLLINFM
jgi:hypothetical protein